MREGVAGGPLAFREFRLLFSTRTISVAGTAFTNVALAFAVLDVTGSKTDLGYVLAARVAPQVVLVLVGGIWADRLPRTRVMFASSILSGLAQGALATLLLSGGAELWSLVVLSIMSGASSAFFFPASQGVIPQTVPRRLLQRANAMLRFGLNAGSIVGAAIAGVLVALTNPGAAIAVDAASYFAAAGLVSMMRIVFVPAAERSTFFRDLGEGWNEFRSRTWLWTIVSQFAILNAVEAGARNVIGPVVAKESLGGAGAWGLILAVLGVGLVSGAATMTWVRPRRLLLTAICSLGLITGLPLTLAFPVSIALVAVGAYLTGFGVETFTVMWDTTMQQEIPQDRLSRLYAYDNLGSIVLVPLGMAIAGPVAAAYGNKAALLGCVALIVLTSIAVLCVRDVRTLERAPTTVIEGSDNPLPELPIV
jgi:MFS family permease